MSGAKDFSGSIDTMGPSLAGRFTRPWRGPRARTFAKGLFAGAYYESRHELFREQYRPALAALLKGKAEGALSLAELGVLHDDAMASLVGRSRLTAPLTDVQAEVIDASSLKAEDKARLLKALLLESHAESEQVRGLTSNQPASWLTDHDSEPEAILRVLVKNGLASGSLDLFSRLMASPDFRKKVKIDGFTSYAGTVSRFRTSSRTSTPSLRPRRPTTRRPRSGQVPRVVADPGASSTRPRRP